MTENKCQNRFRCLTDKKPKGWYCLQDKRIKFTLYQPKSKPVKVRARITARAGNRFLLCDMVKINKKWLGKSALSFHFRNMRIFEYPYLCQEGKKRLEGCALSETTFSNTKIKKSDVPSLLGIIGKIFRRE